jgi:hypothetical protein
MYVGSWKQLFQKHTNYYKKCQWKKCFNKQYSSINSKRWHMYKDFLYFLDNLDHNDRNTTYKVLESFATRNNIDHNKLVKKVFYHCIRMHTVPDKDIANLPEILHQELITNGIIVNQIDVKQDHSKKERKV